MAVSSATVVKHLCNFATSHSVDLNFVILSKYAFFLRGKNISSLFFFRRIHIAIVQMDQKRKSERVGLKFNLMQWLPIIRDMVYVSVSLSYFQIYCWQRYSGCQTMYSGCQTGSQTPYCYWSILHIKKTLVDFDGNRSDWCAQNSPWDIIPPWYDLSWIIFHPSGVVIV